ncbi:hypothetical protein [Weissella paramesenteroides]|uniref:class III lanthionine synthetase LanKC N-terminal domain-containing protein n=1 Tax=Weissella paramesenteroides TaxID=1249 RepID=UPI0018DABEA2|nr:hypothetical protein [Weissella paramesenteroides]QPI45384.1 hypothetical protein I2E55_00120 [Weissella paramesenteroides]QPI45394.1 hypothetical protein I2E55_00055 [Weissella paramesenteroides]
MKSRFEKETKIVDYADELHLSEKVKQTKLYYAVNSDEVGLPEFGWKIHISATLKNAKKTVKRINAVLEDTGIEFKFIKTESILRKTLQKSWPRENSGKFITIYPKDTSEFVRLVEKLATFQWENNFPYILSDEEYKDTPIFYRYGRIKPRNGNKILGPNGEQFIDDPKPYFEIPSWISLPFPGVEEDINNDSVLLNNKYDVTDVVHITNVGGIYKGINRENNKTVLIKESRPNMVIIDNYDALSFRNQEYNLINSMNTAVVPNNIERFNEWKHTYHVYDFIDGEPIFIQKDNLDDLWNKMVATLRQVHLKGIAVGDVSPNNILINKDSPTNLSFIDLETGTSLKFPNYYGLKLRTKGFKLTQYKSLNKYDLLEKMMLSDKEGLALTFLAIIQPNGGVFDIQESNPDLGLYIVKEKLSDSNFTQFKEYLNLQNIQGIENLKVFLTKFFSNNTKSFLINNNEYPQLKIVNIDLLIQEGLLALKENSISKVTHIVARIGLFLVGNNNPKLFATDNNNGKNIKEFLLAMLDKYTLEEILNEIHVE